MTKEQALNLRAAIEKTSASLDDQTASTAVMMFPRLKNDGALVKSGTRINWNGIVKKASVDLWDTEENNPDSAPALWEEILYRDGVRMISAVPSAATAFALGEEGWWDGTIYISKIQSNVWTPESYPNGWEIKT